MSNAPVLAGYEPRAYTRHMPRADATRPIESVLVALNAAHVRYLVVGGVAVVLHGRLRTTADLDLWVELEPENLKRAVAALSALGYVPRAPVRFDEFADAEMRRAWVEEKGLVVFSLWRRDSALEVDLFVRDPLEFAAAHSRALVVTLDTTDACVVGLDDLLTMKRNAARAQDIEDVRALETLRDSGGARGRHA